MVVVQGFIPPSRMQVLTCELLCTAPYMCSQATCRAHGYWPLQQRQHASWKVVCCCHGSSHCMLSLADLQWIFLRVCSSATSSSHMSVRSNLCSSHSTKARRHSCQMAGLQAPRSSSASKCGAGSMHGSSSLQLCCLCVTQLSGPSSSLLWNRQYCVFRLS